MNKKTKTILSHIGCALGGMALGIALLSGLSYCSVSEKAEQTKVNTILTKRNEKTTSPSGLYDKYYFNVESRADQLYTYNEMGANCIATIYRVDVSTYTLTREAYDLEPQLLQNGLSYIQAKVETLMSTWYPSAYGSVRFLLVEGLLDVNDSGAIRYWSYFSFIKKSAPNVQGLKAFALTNRAFALGYLLDTNIAWQGQGSSPLILTAGETDYFTYTDRTPQEDDIYNFQDVASYYQELGYQSGYDKGETTGYNQGLTEGLEYGQEFTTYQVMTQDNNGGTYWPSYGWTINNNAPSGMYGDFSSSTYQIANLLQYKTQDDDLHLIYLMLPIEQSGDLFGHAYIYVYNLTDSVLEDTGLAYGIRYYQTTANEKGWDYAYIFWTSGGTRTLEYGKVTAIYNDSLQKGYIQLNGLVYQETIYNTGYQAGLQAGQTNSHMNNVFSLFTTAFNAVGGFFNLQVFGFLPLYWFFLAPLFVALITLILRMVKH